MANVSLAKLQELKNRIVNLQNAKKNLKEKGTKALVVAADGAVVQTGAFGAGVAQGYFGEKKFFGINWELYAAGLLHAAGIFNVGGKGFARQAHNLANGVLGAFTSAIGRGVGMRMLRRGGGRRPSLKGLERTLDALEGHDSSDGDEPSTDAELLRMARRM